MLHTYLQGFAIGLSLIVAIGAQNAFVLKQGLKKQAVFWVCFVCALSDSILVVLGITGFATVIQLYPELVGFAKWAGAVFLVWYGLQHAMKGCLATRLGSMSYRMVATPEFTRHWFPQGLHRNALKMAPAVIYNDKDHIHTDIILARYGLNIDGYPHHYIPSSTAFVEAIAYGLGFGMVPDYQIGQRLLTGEWVEILPEARTDIQLYWHHWKQQSVALEKLTTTLLQKAHLKMNQA
jgi:hypothetical protein